MIREIFLRSNMLGLMQNKQLLVSSIIDFADKNYGDVEIISKVNKTEKFIELIKLIINRK